jgi:putative hydrolase of the HAD superfamily
MPYRAVLWDFGGVLSSSPFEAFARYEAERGLPDGFLRRVNATNPDDNAWARLERNDVGLDAFAELFAQESAALGHAVDGHDVLGLLSGELRPAMLDAVRACRAAGLRTALLTNNVVTMPADGEGDVEGWRSRVLLDELFDVVVESSKEKVRKPDPAAYALVLERLGVAAEEVVFLDDLGINLKPAKAMGMTTIKVSDPDEALAQLSAILGLPLGAGAP